MKFIAPLILVLVCYQTQSQDFRWQQRVEYTMDVVLDVNTHHMKGNQKLVYFNNSPDTLRKVYYHLYFNAFQPGSMMDVRSRNLVDPDRRIGERISKLSESEIGYQKILSLKQDGKELNTNIMGTVMEVILLKPLLPKSKTTFELNFEAQVPVQIRRSGRNNSEGIAYSMTQWYPKIAEYDFQGWHAYPYVAREFHSVWGDFDVSITLDSSFTVAATGVLQNPDAAGHGYGSSAKKTLRQSPQQVWHFVAKNVIDFAWAADPDYTHDRIKVPGGPELHFFYQKNSKTEYTWKAVQPIGVQVFQYLQDTYGKYPYETYSIIQGGDGGMEYPMCTLILGEGKLDGLATAMTHEATHSWFGMTLASNEALYAWMDEGFTDFAEDEALAYITRTDNDHAASYKVYFAGVNNGQFEIPGQHSDHFATNRGYRNGTYVAGAIFLHQLKYIIGTDNFYKGMKRYYETWKFRHPEPNDMLRVMEKTSGIQLHWYYRYWINTTRKIDYAIREINPQKDHLEVILQRAGDLPMPVDLMITYKDGSREMMTIPLNEMLGAKPQEDVSLKTTTLQPWAWVDPSYSLTIQRNPAEIESLEIDPSLRMADINRTNNKVIVDQPNRKAETEGH